MKWSDLYKPDGTPRFIRCFEMKRHPTLDRFTCVFTNANRAGFPAGIVQYRGMSSHPYHPQGFGQWGEAPQGQFRGGGSRVLFESLPDDVRQCILNDYRDIWQNKITDESISATKTEEPSGAKGKNDEI